MIAFTAIRVLMPLALAVIPLALHAAPANKTMRVYSARMETLFIRLDVNRDGRLDASEVQGRRALSRRLKRQNNRSYLYWTICVPKVHPPAANVSNIIFVRLIATATVV